MHYHTGFSQPELQIAIAAAGANVDTVDSLMMMMMMLCKLLR